MGYGSVYADRTVSYITPREAKFIDRVFMKALAMTEFGRKMLDRQTLIGDEVAMHEGAEKLYQQTGCNIFADNEFAFRHFTDTRESEHRAEEVAALPLLKATPVIQKRFGLALLRAIGTVDDLCIPGHSWPFAKKPFKDGAHELYGMVSEVAPMMLFSPDLARYVQREESTIMDLQKYLKGYDAKAQHLAKHDPALETMLALKR